MSVKKDGHVFRDSDGRCIHCGRRLQHYLDCSRSLSKWENEAPVRTIATMLCDHIISKPPTESDFIAPVGWGTYYRRQYYPKVKLNEIPEQVYYQTSSGRGSDGWIKHYYNDIRTEYIVIGE
jgi:hypothetical protein